MNNKVKLCSILSENKDLVMILNIIDTFNLKNYYIHGEIVYQSVWNYLENRTPSYKNRRISSARNSAYLPSRKRFTKNFISLWNVL